jgi:hypothetical protein
MLRGATSVVLGVFAANGSPVVPAAPGAYAIRSCRTPHPRRPAARARRSPPQTRAVAVRFCVTLCTTFHLRCSYTVVMRLLIYRRDET